MPYKITDLDRRAMKEIGLRLRARRKHLKVSQTRLANAIGVTFQAVQKYESGEHRVSVIRLLRICDFLQCKITYFVEDVSLEPPPPYQTLAMERHAP